MPSSLARLIAIAAAGAAVSAAAQTKLPEEDRLRLTGETADCIDIARIERSRILDAQTILFEMKGGPQYMNRLDVRCPGLVTERSYTYSLPTRRLCKEDVIRVFQPETGATRGTCPLGPFRVVEPAGSGTDAPDEAVPPHRDGGV